tara:strand:+ start:209 stop:1072 length:864 start_codon:yes stop_codon:yes gene_type:complete
MERGVRIMKIGIVGQGYVGTAVKTVFEKHYDINTFDLNGNCSCDSLDDLVIHSDIIFVCVPTPMKKDGSCDTSIVEGVVKDINGISYWADGERIVAIKSTVPPGTTNNLNKKSENITVIFNPEFLTEANFIDDFKNQNRIIIGGQRPATTRLRQIYSLAFPDATIVKTGSKTAEMVKYFTNTFLATKVSFANEMYQICSRLGIDYDKVVEYSTYDERLGKSHWAVPGPDGHFGFGGSCFPKDINALIQLGLELDMTPEVLIAAWHTNLDVRPEEDWKELRGRAVVDE